MPNSGAETSQPQGTAMIPVDSLVPVDTQLITPALAEAFDLPYNFASSNDLHLASQAQSLPQTLMPQTTAMKPSGEFPYQVSDTMPCKADLCIAIADLVRSSHHFLYALQECYTIAYFLSLEGSHKEGSQIILWAVQDCL